MKNNNIKELGLSDADKWLKYHNYTLDDLKKCYKTLSVSPKISNVDLYLYISYWNYDKMSSWNRNYDENEKAYRIITEYRKRLSTPYKFVKNESDEVVGLEDLELTLLSKADLYNTGIFGNGKKVKAEVTDGAVLLGGGVQKAIYTSYDGIKYYFPLTGCLRDEWRKEPITNYWLRTDSRFSSPVVFGEEVGQRSYYDYRTFDSKNIYGVRPVVKYSSIKDIATAPVKDKNGFLRVKCGEMYQNVVSDNIDEILENNYRQEKLQTTGKTYYLNAENTSEPEYVYEGKKYVRIPFDYKEHYPLSNGTILGGCIGHLEKRYYWLKVEQVEWLVDLENDQAVSDKIISAHIYNNYESESYYSEQLPDVFSKASFKSKFKYLTFRGTDDLLWKMENYESTFLHPADDIFRYTDIYKYLNIHLKKNIFSGMAMKKEEVIKVDKTIKELLIEYRNMPIPNLEVNNADDIFKFVDTLFSQYSLISTEIENKLRMSDDVDKFDIMSVLEDIVPRDNSIFGKIFKKRQNHELMNRKSKTIDDLEDYLSMKSINLKNDLKQIQYIKDLLEIYLTKADKYLEILNTKKQFLENALVDKSSEEVKHMDHLFLLKVLNEKITYISSSIIQMKQQYEKTILQMGAHVDIINQIDASKDIALKKLRLEFLLNKKLMEEKESLCLIKDFVELFESMDSLLGKNATENIHTINQIKDEKNYDKILNAAKYIIENHPQVIECEQNIECLEDKQLVKSKP